MKTTTKAAYRPSGLIALVLALALLSGCTAAQDILSVLVQPQPTEESTLTDIGPINASIETAVKNGEKSITLDVTTSEEEISDIMNTLNPFWGMPTEYKIIKRFSGVALSDGEHDVMRIAFALSQSDNYYVFKAYTDASYTIPEDQTRATEIFGALPAILAEIETRVAKNAGNPTYAAALAVHDWLVEDLSYDDSVDQLSFHNGTYGALIERKTMCLGYAEALQLIMLCRGERNISLIVGDGDSGNGEWVGHAWNIIMVGDRWMHIDATFDDPKDNPPGEISHIYFGQNDAFMQKDHKWVAAYYPACDDEDYYYFRANGLYVGDKKAFRTVLRNYITKNKPTTFELVTTGFKLGDDDLQFIYSIKTAVSEIYRTFIDEGDATVVRLTLRYE